MLIEILTLLTTAAIGCVVAFILVKIVDILHLESYLAKINPFSRSPSGIKNMTIITSGKDIAKVFGTWGIPNLTKDSAITYQNYLYKHFFPSLQFKMSSQEELNYSFEMSFVEKASSYQFIELVDELTRNMEIQAKFRNIESGEKSIIPLTKVMIIIPPTSNLTKQEYAMAKMFAVYRFWLKLEEMNEVV